MELDGGKYATARSGDKVTQTQTDDQKLKAAGEILDGYDVDTATVKRRILALKLGSWGLVCNFLNCAKKRVESANITPKTCSDFTSTPTTTTTQRTTTTKPGTSRLESGACEVKVCRI